MSKINKDNAQQFYERLFGQNSKTETIAFFSKGSQGKSTTLRELASGCAKVQSTIAAELRHKHGYSIPDDKGKVLLVDLDLRKPNQLSINEAVIASDEKRHKDASGERVFPTLYHLIDGSATSLDELIVQTTLPGYNLVLGENSHRQKQGIDKEFISKLQSYIAGVVSSGKYSKVMLDVAGSNNDEILPFVNMADKKIGVSGAEKLSLTEVVNVVVNDLLYSIGNGFESFFAEKLEEAKEDKEKKNKLLEYKEEIIGKLKKNNDDLDALYVAAEELGDKKVRGELMRIIRDNVNEATYGLIFSRISKPSAARRNYLNLEEDLLNLSKAVRPGLGVHNLNGWGYAPHSDLVVESTDKGVPLYMAKHTPGLVMADSSLINRLHKEAKHSDFVSQIEGMVNFLVYNPITHKEMSSSGSIGLSRKYGSREKL